MTNEQCVEVAEKVWGWKRLHDGFWSKPDGSTAFFRSDQSDPIVDEEIPREVNSWSGFGKTVEAMARHDRLTIKNFSQPYTDYLRSRISLEEMIEATHLAALEAMKGER